MERVTNISLHSLTYHALLSCSAHRSINLLTGTLPPEWSRMTAIEDIKLGETLLSGPLPQTWGSWKAVQKIGLELNRFVGTVPSTWGAMGKTLTYLGLKGNTDLTGCLPRGLDKFKDDKDACDDTGLTCKVC